MSETSLSSIDPQVDIVQNEDTTNQPAETTEQSSVEKQMSDVLGINLTGVETPKSLEAEQPKSEDPAETAQAEATEEAQGQQPLPQEEELNDSNFLGQPDENGNYTLSEKRLQYLRDRLLQTAQAVNEREAYLNQQLNNQQRQIEAFARARQRAYEQNQTFQQPQQQGQPQQPSEPKPDKWAQAKEQFTTDLAAVMGEEDAKKYADAHFNLISEAIKEQQRQGFEEFGREVQPTLSRVKDAIYKEDVLQRVNDWSSNISEDLANFNVPREAAEPEVRTFVANFIRGFAENAGRRPTPDEIDEGIARVSGKLTTSVLLNRMQENIRQRQLTQQGQPASATVSQAPATAPQPPAQPQVKQAPAPAPQIKKTTEPSTSVARKMVTTGENLRMANDAGLMGTPSGGASTGNPSMEKMAQAIAQSNGGRRFILTE